MAIAQRKAGNPDLLETGPLLPKLLKGQRLEPPQWLVLRSCCMAQRMAIRARLPLLKQTRPKWKVRLQAPRRKNSWSLQFHAIDAESLSLSTNFTLTACDAKTDPTISAYPVTGLAKAVFTGMASALALFNDTNAPRHPVATLPATSCLIDCGAISISGLLLEVSQLQDSRTPQHPTLPNAYNPVPSVPNASPSPRPATGNAPSATKANTASATPVSTRENAAPTLCSP